MKTEEAATSFRDRVSTIDSEGKRKWVYPKKPKGKFHNKRLLVSLILLIILFAGPFIRISGEPLLMLNIPEGKFIIFGNIFWPQDFYLFGLMMIAFVLFIALFTVVFGRVFCGWICPQTIFMEMVFRKIEYWIEGDYKAQRLLNNQPWDANKILKKTSKHIIFFVIAFLIGNTFLAYIVGTEGLFKMVNEGPAENAGTFISMIVFSLAFYYIFAFFREQVCVAVCPYGRLQGVLLDRHSMVVAYDYKRGENRGLFRKNEDRAESNKGDCIDCNQCVDVCPTGIDIRNGTQLECINCTACMDACDFMMEKTGLNKGLIRLASEASIAEGERFKWTPRMIGYSGILGVLLVIITVVLFSRTEVKAYVLRAPGMLYQEYDSTHVSNLYNLKLLNKTNRPLHLDIKPDNPHVKIKQIGSDIVVPAGGTAQHAFFLIIPKEDIHSVKNKLEVTFFEGDEEITSAKTFFMGPKSTL